MSRRVCLLLGRLCNGDECQPALTLCRDFRHSKWLSRTNRPALWGEPCGGGRRGPTVDHSSAPVASAGARRFVVKLRLVQLAVVMAATAGMVQASPVSFFDQNLNAGWTVGAG